MTGKAVLKNDFEYSFDKLNKSVDKCDNSALEWIMTSVRSNEKALCKGEITESIYNDRQQKISGLVANFSYNCRCTTVSKAQML